MAEITPPLFSTKFNAGRRNFFFDVRKTKDDKPYIRISEASVKANGEKQRANIMIFESEIENFKSSLSQVFGFVETIK